MKVTMDVDPNLYRAVKVEAARSDRSVRDIVDEALQAWLEEAESQEDRASAEDALVEYRRDGGDAAESFFASLAAETQATYGSGEESAKPTAESSIAPAAQRQLRRLPPGEAARLRGPILSLAIEPRPPGVAKLGGTELWRVRVGDLRFIYAVDDVARSRGCTQGRPTLGEHVSSGGSSIAEWAINWSRDQQSVRSTAA